jgi:hypothetical protein
MFKGKLVVQAADDAVRLACHSSAETAGVIEEILS